MYCSDVMGFSYSSVVLRPLPLVPLPLPLGPPLMLGPCLVVATGGLMNEDFLVNGHSSCV